MNPYGVSDKIWQILLGKCFSHPEVVRVILYGSRARGDYRPGSDIDIAIDAPSMSDHEFSKLWNELDDLPILFALDIVHLQRLENQALLHAIQTEGICLKPFNFPDYSDCK